MTCIPAPACKVALTQATQLWPGRSTAGDGICASAAHNIANPTSDHRYGNAFDLTQDPAHGCDCNKLAPALAARKDVRVKYIIWNRGIWEPGKGWQHYTGTDPHTGHMHVSIYGAARNNSSPWWTTGSTSPTKDEVLAMVNGVAAVAMIPGSDTAGYVATLDGGIYPFGGAAAHEDPNEAAAGRRNVNNAYGRTGSPIVDLLVNANGYTLVEANGGAFPFGNGPVVPSLYGQIRYP